MKDIEDKLAAFLMEYGVLKNRDAEKMARKIVEMLEKEREELRTELDKLRCAYGNVCDNAVITEKERDQLAAKLDRISRHVRCMYCNKEYSFDDSDQLADHIMSCEKSPVVDMVHKMEHRIMDYMDLMNDEFQRILAITDNQEIIGICDRAQQVITQKEPVIKQRDDALDKLRLSEAQVVQLLDENTRLKLDWSHSEAENAQLAAKCAEMRDVLESAWAAIWDGHYSGKGVSKEYAQEIDRQIKHTKSDDCGKGWLSPEKAGRLREELEKCRDFFEDRNPAICESIKRTLEKTK